MRIVNLVEEIVLSEADLLLAGMNEKELEKHITKNGGGKKMVEERGVVKGDFQKWDREVDICIKAGNDTMLKLAEALYQIQQGKLYEPHYKSSTAYIETKKELSKGYASKLVAIWQLGLTKAIEKKEIGWSKAYKILPVMKYLPKEKREEVIELAQDTPLAKINDELIIQGYKKGADKPEEVSIIITGIKKEEKAVIVEILQEISKATGKTQGEILVEWALEHQPTGKEAEKNHKKAQETNKKAIAFRDLFCGTYKEQRGKKYLWRGAKDMKLAKAIVGVYEQKELVEMLEKFFATTGKEKWWKGYGLNIFYTALDDFIRPRGKYADVKMELVE